MTGAETVERNDENDTMEVFGDLLSFYGSEVVSHGGLAVGFVIALLTLFQSRSSLSSFLFGSLLFIVVSGLMYVVLRIVWYGSLSGIVTNCSVKAYTDFVKDHKNYDWLPLAKASNFVRYMLEESIRMFWSQKWRILYANRWVLRVVSIAAGALSVILVGLFH